MAADFYLAWASVSGLKADNLLDLRPCRLSTRSGLLNRGSSFGRFRLCVDSHIRNVVQQASFTYVIGITFLRVSLWQGSSLDLILA